MADGTKETSEHERHIRGLIMLFGEEEYTDWKFPDGFLPMVTPKIISQSLWTWLEHWLRKNDHTEIREWIDLFGGIGTDSVHFLRHFTEVESATICEINSDTHECLTSNLMLLATRMRTCKVNPLCTDCILWWNEYGNEHGMDKGAHEGRLIYFDPPWLDYTKSGSYEFPERFVTLLRSCLAHSQWVMVKSPLNSTSFDSCGLIHHTVTFRFKNLKFLLMAAGETGMAEK